MSSCEAGATVISLPENTTVPSTKCSGCTVEVRGHLSCPTCLKLSLPPARFCSQDCFRKSWPMHKKLHTAMQQFVVNKAAGSRTCGYQTLLSGFRPNDTSTWSNDKHLAPFQGFKFRGPLRPWPRTEIRSVPTHISKPDYFATGVSAGEAQARRTFKIVERTPDEIEILRRVCRLGREALDMAHSMVKSGVTAESIDKAVHHFIVDRGGYPSPLNYAGFPKSCCISVNEVICHGIPDLRPLEDGDIVNIDITVFKEGFHGDLNETFVCGEVDQPSKYLMKGAYESMMLAIAALGLCGHMVQCRPGVMYREIGEIISKTAEDRGLSVVRSYCGHGIGELFHTTPTIPHYRHNKAMGVMKVGHVFTIEPMINQGSWKDVRWPDDWTSTTVDGRRSAQYEHTLVITKTGVEILTGRLDTSPSLEIDVLPEKAYLSFAPLSA